MKKPNVFIIGAPKCGTTAISGWLAAHPGACMARKKEPHYFYTPYGYPMGKEEYESLFAHAGDEHTVVFEASVWYLFSGTAVNNILDYNPNAKFIICIRNPMEMAPSLHNQLLSTNHEWIVSFEKAWSATDRANDIRKRLLKTDVKDASILNYQETCRLGTQIKNVLDIVSRDRVHFILLEEIKKNPRKVWLNLLRFLELPDDGRTMFEVVNASVKKRSYIINKILIKLGDVRQMISSKNGFGVLRKLHEFNTKREKWPSLSLNMRRELLNAFSEEIDMLGELLQRDLSDWKMWEV